MFALKVVRTLQKATPSVRVAMREFDEPCRFWENAGNILTFVEQRQHGSKNRLRDSILTH